MRDSVNQAQVRVKTTSARLSPAEALVNFSSRRIPVVLESSVPTGGYGRFSIVACDPAEVVSIPYCEATQSDPIERLRRSLTLPTSVVAPSVETPFVGGWIGFLTYEAGLISERIPAASLQDPELPAARFALYDTAAIFNHTTHQWHVAAVDWPARTGHRPPAAQRLEKLESVLQSVSRPSAQRARNPRDVIAEPNMTHDQYVAKVRKSIRHIEAGDIYQVNLTQRFSVASPSTPFQLYRRLREVCPSPFAAYLPYDDFSVISASPELFLQLRGKRVITRPIKGTCPRGTHALDDARRRFLLNQSEKERAELNMIVDLLRNDLGRVCEFGSVRVLSDGDIESHPNVHHRVATIEGRLAEGHDWGDLLRATFPGGSITGAPKIRAMRIISELEPTTRGVYCGTIGWIGLDGSATFNVAIRTMVHVGNIVHAYAGGAITADSDPEAEYQETLAKATGMFRALGCRTKHDTDEASKRLRIGGRLDCRDAGSKVVGSTAS